MRPRYKFPSNDHPKCRNADCEHYWEGMCFASPLDACGMDEDSRAYDAHIDMMIDEYRERAR